MTLTPEALAQQAILGCSHGRWIGPNDVFGVCGSCLVAVLTEQAREIEMLTKERNLAIENMNGIERLRGQVAAYQDDLERLDALTSLHVWEEEQLKAELEKFRGVLTTIQSYVRGRYCQVCLFVHEKCNAALAPPPQATP